METPSYYAVIPANVRYAPITPNAKLLYGELTCLSQQEGFCWASNGYLAKLYDAGERTVSRWLSELEKAGFIVIEAAVNQHGQRRIFIQSALPKVASQKWQAKNGDHNNTSDLNTTSKGNPSVVSQTKAPEMPTLEQALSSFSQTLTDSRQQSGANGQTSNSDGTASASASSGTISTITGPAATLSAEDSREIGLPHGGAIVVATPRTADEAAVLAERLVGDLLPPSLASWLAAQEAKARTGMEPFPRVPEPEKTPEMLLAVSTALKSLSEILEPSARRRPELAVEIAKLFAAFNLYTGDAAKSAAQVEVWGEQLGEFPLFAIRKAFRWAVRGEGKMPSLSSFIVDVRLAIGAKVQERKRLLQQWSKQ